MFQIFQRLAFHLCKTSFILFVFICFSSVFTHCKTFYRDIMPLFRNHAIYRAIIDALVSHAKQLQPQVHVHTRILSIHLSVKLDQSTNSIGDSRFSTGESRLLFRAVGRIGSWSSVRRRTEGWQTAWCLSFYQLRTGIRRGRLFIRILYSTALYSYSSKIYFTVLLWYLSELIK